MAVTFLSPTHLAFDFVLESGKVASARYCRAAADSSVLSMRHGLQVERSPEMQHQPGDGPSTSENGAAAAGAPLSIKLANGEVLFLKSLF